METPPAPPPIPKTQLPPRSRLPGRVVSSCSRRIVMQMNFLHDTRGQTRRSERHEVVPPQPAILYGAAQRNGRDDFVPGGLAGLPATAADGTGGSPSGSSSPGGRE